MEEIQMNDRLVRKMITLFLVVIVFFGTVSYAEAKTVKKEVLGFTVKYNKSDISSYKVMNKQSEMLTSIAAATHVVDGLGTIRGTSAKEQITLANERNMNATLMIGNEFNRENAHRLLNSKTNRTRFAKNTLAILKKDHYKGVNIDIENVQGSDRNVYTKLIKELAEVLKPKGFSLSVSLQPKTADHPLMTWNYAYDYKAIAKYVDYLLIMTYDEHYKSSLPGSVASIGWVKKVVAYTKTVVPADKILLGIGSYGYDWSTKGKTVSRTYEESMKLAKKYKVKIVFDRVTKTPNFSYKDGKGIRHIVWFENAQSLSYKLDVVNAENLKGIGIWRLGHNQDEQYWNMITSKLSK